jgi:hypothetical protein
MPKSPLSITLDTANITWLKARARAVGARGVSELVDGLITDARTKSPAGAVRSVVGTVDLDPSDPLLMGADDVLRALVQASMERPMAVKESKAAYAAKRTRHRG